jgi:hypothetical protein
MRSTVKVKLFTILFISLWLSLLVFKKISHYLNVFIKFVYTYIKKDNDTNISNQSSSTCCNSIST